MIRLFENRKHCLTDSLSLLNVSRLRIFPLPGGTWTRLPKIIKNCDNRQYSKTNMHQHAMKSD